MMRNIVLTALSGVLLSSCAFFSPKDEDRTYYYLTGKDITPETTSEQVVNVIGRSMTMAGGNYEVQAYPITRSLLEVQARELAKSRGLSEEQVKKVNLTHEQEFLAQKNCFNVSFAVVNFEQASQLEDWKIHFIDAGLDEYPMLWRDEDLKRRSVRTKLQRQEGNLDRWLGHGIVCTDSPFPLEKGFGLKITPKYVQWPFPASQKLLWEFDYVDTNEQGEEVLVKKVKQDYQPYRGW
ncbi:MAG: hypothetical protein COW00_06650 [Bdellovibrio sp. CG12_big_fil_rev_8_21_14_0_65_39_13]|nr:MAG: hypothetical protein COW78_15630 [Bdellovibrio sp. CG22_combo_CG10-13_8_21_14_all_39_27]PIQ60460.1 MAG: hypothetical protein COW00_06650 [Bdellovibrio sp. CG12_big_fil_rev_8_21_14_0_65_39_13]PIR33869.1 MAG: hypothetical protein COV37_14840 [Bdellovibrio sp. CG11_big_fil_rev_8_21_14_0_20_39_38]